MKENEKENNKQKPYFKTNLSVSFKRQTEGEGEGCTIDTQTRGGGINGIKKGDVRRMKRRQREGWVEEEKDEKQKTNAL